MERIPVLPIVLALLGTSISMLPLGAQPTGELSGTVRSRVLGPAAEPVEGVFLRMPALGLGAVTGSDGRFRMAPVPEGRHEIRAELLGCPVHHEVVEVRGGGRVVLDIVVEQPVFVLPEFLVTRYGDPGEGRDETRARSRIEVDRTRSARTVADLIRGEFPGVRIVQGSGLPGSEGAIQTRGPRSITTQGTPLVVIDGMVVTGGFGDINVSDVQSVTVLRGAAAAAEYGARGQAGVIEITTWTSVPGAGPGLGPIILVDGAYAPGGLMEIEGESIGDTNLVVGPAAGVLMGVGGARRGILNVMTLDSGDRAGSRTAAVLCSEDPAPL